MLFIIVMDVLNSVFVKAGEMGLLQPLTRRVRLTGSPCMRMMWLFSFGLMKRK